MEINVITEGIIGAAIRVHRHLGPGLLESAYQKPLAVELGRRRLRYTAEQRIPIEYEDIHIANAYRADFIVEESVVVEVKSVRRFDPIHTAQLLTYLKLSGCRVGLLINFNVPVLVHGVRRFIV